MSTLTARWFEDPDKGAKTIARKRAVVTLRELADGYRADKAWDFLGFSYGFHPERGQHDALDALSYALLKKKVNYILDADIASFFDNLDKSWLIKFLEHRVPDPPILRLIQKWLKAGVMEEGKWPEPKTGSPPGSVISPLLANIYLHYAFDLWVNVWRKKWAQREVVVIRYADDTIVGFQYRADADRFLTNLRERLAMFGLELRPDKTRHIEFGRFAEENRKRRGEGKPDFLDFTRVSGKNRYGWFTVRRMTVRKRMRAKLREIKQQLRTRVHDPVSQSGSWLVGCAGPVQLLRDGSTKPRQPRHVQGTNSMGKYIGKATVQR